jgi:predicted TIM-barrel fold metal-dependent hydrolase
LKLDASAKDSGCTLPTANLRSTYAILWFADRRLVAHNPSLARSGFSGCEVTVALRFSALFLEAQVDFSRGLRDTEISRMIGGIRPPATQREDMQDHPAFRTTTIERNIDRRAFMRSAVAIGALPAALTVSDQAHAAPSGEPPIIDTHMHVWANNPLRYPFFHPYVKDFKSPLHEATVEMLMEDMDRHGCTHSVLVQVIYHGWDNAYVADCVKLNPERLRAHGLIDPTDPKVADKMEFWIKEHGLNGMRFSAIYYQNRQHGGDSWINASETHRLWRKAEELGAVFNFFIAPRQLPKLEQMVRAHPDVRIVIDHLSQIDFGVENPEPDLQLLLAMARYPNVWVKVSELSSVSKSGTYPFTDAYPYVKRVYEAFGPERLLFGTGYPGAARAAYERPPLDKEIDLIRKKIPFFSPEDREKILGRNAARLWGFA